MIYRQGDVLLRQVAALPDNVKPVPKDNERLILAYGEATGHGHAVSGNAVLYEAEQVAARYLMVLDRATLTHEEHDPIHLPSGVYQVVIQREYTPQGLRNVTD